MAAPRNGMHQRQKLEHKLVLCASHGRIPTFRGRLLWAMLLWATLLWATLPKAKDRSEGCWFANASPPGRRACRRKEHI